jgi:hypothetical protein
LAGCKLGERIKICIIAVLRENGGIPGGDVPSMLAGERP